MGPELNQEAPLMNDQGGQHRQQALYWAKLVELKVAASYVRRYRDHLGRWVTAIATLRAVASSASIAVWAVWKQYPLLWGGIIAVSQVADAVKDVFPVNKKHKSTIELTVALDRLFIDAQLEWESIFAERYTGDQILTRLHKLRRLQHEAEAHNLRGGLPLNAAFQVQAQREADAFFENTYGVHYFGEGKNG
jgi:hypothetical protein